MCFYFQPKCTNLFETPLIISSGKNIWSITKETIAVLLVSNHEEDDNILLFHIGMSNEAAVIVEKDEEVFLLLIYAFLDQLKSFFS